MITDRVHAQAKKRARAERRDKNSSAVDKELKELRTTLQREVAEKEQLRQVSIFVCVLQRGRREGAATSGVPLHLRSKVLLCGFLESESKVAMVV